MLKILQNCLILGCQGRLSKSVTDLDIGSSVWHHIDNIRSREFTSKSSTENCEDKIRTTDSIEPAGSQNHQSSETDVSTLRSPETSAATTCASPTDEISSPPLHWCGSQRILAAPPDRYGFKP